VPAIFGDQPVVNAEDEIEAFETRLLSAPTRLAVRDLAAAVHARGGLFVAAHADRPSFSISSQLGVLAGDEGFDAMELTPGADAAHWARRFPGLPILRASDAHRLQDIGAAWNEAALPALSVAALRDALAAGAVRGVVA